MGKKFSKNFIPDSVVSSNSTRIIFFRKFGLAPDLDLHHDPDLGLELLEVPPTACDLPGYQKWPYKPAWAFSFWPGPRPAPGYYRNAAFSHISRNLSVLFVRQMEQFFNPPSPLRADVI